MAKTLTLALQGSRVGVDVRLHCTKLISGGKSFDVSMIEISKGHSCVVNKTDHYVFEQVKGWRDGQAYCNEKSYSLN